MRMMTALLVFASVSMADLIVNGSFEDNTASSHLFNPSNASFNSFVANVTAYGVRQGIDLQTTGSPYGLAPQDGSWKVSPASDSGGNAEEFSMDLTGPLSVGASYTLDFYIETLTSGSFNGGSVEVGLSTSATSFGTQIGSATAPTSGWLLSSTTFFAPIAGSYITVRVTNASNSWVGLDNFQLTADVAPIPEPGTYALFGLAALAYGIYRRHKSA